MNPVVKNKFVAALRSGEYKQGQGQLRTINDKFCCLGVLCDLAAKEGVIEPPEKLDGDCFSGYRYDGHASLLPNSVRAWAGSLKMLHLINMNDAGNSFKKIADYIEKNH